MKIPIAMRERARLAAPFGSAIIVIATQVAACAASPTSDSTADENGLRVTRAFGEPLPGLTSEQLDRFAEGRAVFLNEEDAEDGLGPVFNDTSCANCHSSPAIGGGADRIETRFGANTAGRFDPLAQRGGSLIQERGIGIFAECNYVGEIVPPEANVRAGRRTTPLFGLGLVDAVPDATFRRLAEEQRTRTPATAGTVSIVPNLVTGQPSVGKFGWKSQNPNLLQFAGDAYLNEMGITSPMFPDENCPQGDCALLVCNPVPELNDDGDDVVAFADFMAFLAPPPRHESSAASHAGEARFNQIGCADCHTPALRTGPHPVAALSTVTFHPYSDFLLHDMGALGDGIEQNGATGTQMRTAPLWGVSQVGVLLHDGRAHTLADAILAHDGQGKPARDRFASLPAVQREQLLAFLNSL
jgi:CxxC motif-containing protein (DUF1111 family)